MLKNAHFPFVKSTVHFHQLNYTESGALLISTHYGSFSQGGPKQAVVINIWLPVKNSLPNYEGGSSKMAKLLPKQ